MVNSLNLPDNKSVVTFDLPVLEFPIKFLLARFAQYNLTVPYTGAEPIIDPRLNTGCKTGWLTQLIEIGTTNLI